MKNIIFSVFICLFLVSCVEWTRKQTDYHYIVNQSNKKVVHILYSNHELIKEDSLVFQIHENTDTTLEWKVSAIVGFGENFSHLSYSSFRIYNLTDTTSNYWENFWGGYEYNNTIPEILNKRDFGLESDNNKKETNKTIRYYWTINDTLLSLMKKDYSMIERFKEYYQK